MRKTFSSGLLGVTVLFLLWACQDSKQSREIPIKEVPINQNSAPQAKVEKKPQEQKEWKLLAARCFSLKKQFPSLPPRVRKDMAFYLGEADAGLKAALSSFRNPSLDFMNPNFVKQTLDDTRWFLDQIEKCIEAGKKSRPLT